MFRDWIFGEIYFPILDSWSIFWRTIPMSYPILAGFSSRVSACHRIFSKLLVDDSVDVFFRKFMVRCWFQWIFFLRFRLSRREWTEWMFFFSVISPYPLVNIQNYGTSPFFMGKSTISMGHLYHGYVNVYQAG
jgi:hypothetical protein